MDRWGTAARVGGEVYGELEEAYAGVGVYAMG